MDHAEVREQLELEALEPARLEALLAGRGQQQLVEHHEGCEECRAEAAALRATTRLLAAAAPDRMRAPEGARERLLARARQDRPDRQDTPSEPPASLPPSARRPSVLAGLATAAAIVVLAGAGLLAFDLSRQRDLAAQQARGLGRAAATTDELLRDPDHRRAVLTDRTSQPSGSVIVSATSGKLVVLSERLPEPPAGRRYGCFIERDGRLVNIGWMAYADDLAFWVGGVGDLPDPGREGDRFVISLEEDGSSPVLAGDF